MVNVSEFFGGHRELGILSFVHPVSSHSNFIQFGFKAMSARASWTFDG